MKSNNTTFLQRIMEDMDSDQLNEMLQEELQKDNPDGDAIRMAMRVLGDREKTQTEEYDQDIKEAWEKYQADSKIVVSASPRRYSAVLKVAAVVLILFVVFMTIPQTVKASGIFDRIARWTDSFFELLTSEEQADKHSEYVFETDNPALQQVFDAVVKLGVTEPVVPMWIPETYQSVICKLSNKADCDVLIAEFINGEKRAIMQISVFSENMPSTYYKDDRDIEIYETNGMEFIIMRNNARRVVVWERDNIECVVSLDCQEDELYRMLDSIYLVGDE